MIYPLCIAILIVIFSAILLIAAAWFCGDKVAYPAPESTYKDTPEVFKLKLSDGTLISARMLENANSDKCILYSHGNREDIFSISDTLERYRDSGYNILAYDYCGYGTSQGVPTEKSALECADAAYDFLVREKAFKPEKIIAEGFSIGSVTASYTASTRKVGALVIIGGLAKSSYAILPFDLFFWNWLDNLDRMKKIKAPTLFVHGSADRILPLRNGKMLFKACAAQVKRLKIMEGFGHNKMPESQIYWDVVLDFLKENVK